MNNRLRTFNRSCWSKSRVNNKLLCLVCYTYCPSQSFSTIYCCSPLTKHRNREICDECVHQHIISILSSCLTSSISCPEMHCRAQFTQAVICHMLLKYEDSNLLNDYLREQQWEGKNSEWIKRFTLRCPGCHVPIEKNGGCDEMICSRCQIHFYWSKANRYYENNKKKQKSSFISDYANISIITIVILFVFSIVMFFFNKKN